TVAGTVNVMSRLNNTSPLSSSALRIKSNVSNGFGGTKEWIIFSQTMPQGIVYTFNFSINITVAPGEKLFMIGTTGTVNASQYQFEYLEGSKAHVTFKSRYPATYSRALRPQYVFTELINKVTGGEYQAAVCPYLASVADRVLRSGDAIRGQEKPLLKISLDNLFEWLDCRDGIGMYVDSSGKVAVDLKSNMVNYSSTIKLSNVSDVQVSLESELAFNELQIGYPEFKNDVGALNGNNEFNTRFTFSAGALRSSRTLTKISPVRFSCYEQENIRVSLDGKNSTDNKNDNNLYGVHIDNVQQPAAGTIQAHYLIDRTANTYITGVVEAATVYNVQESPRRMFERNSGFLHSLFFKCDTITLNFASADKNSAMVYTPPGGTAIPEKDPFNIGAMNPQFFTPVQVSVTCRVPDDLLDLLDSNPLQALEFDLDGETYMGLPQSIGYDPVTMKAQSVTMLLGPNNNFSKLIEYYG
ncbi:MAG: hypothetical protein ACRC1V_04880, partial [Plesiomonas sp.]